MYTNIFLRALTVFFIRKTDLLICSTMLIEKGMRLWLSKKHQLRISYKTIKQGQPWQTTSPMPCFVQCYQHNTLSLIDDGTGARYVRCSILTTTQSVCPSIGARMFQASKPPTNSSMLLHRYHRPHFPPVFAQQDLCTSPSHRRG